MKLPNGYRAAIAAATMMLTAGTAVQAAEKLTLYCSPQIEWCQLVIEEFQKATGIKVAMTRKSSGETFAQINAERKNPKGDVWWGGTGDPHLQAAEEGLTEEYKSPMLSKLHPWAQSQAKQSGYKTVGIYMGALGFGYNTELLAKKGLPEPKCWKDLIKPAYKGEVQIANPNSSGTAYTTLATIVQLFGEDGGFDYMKQLHKNINQYTKSGSAPIKAAARGETTIGIVFLHDAVTQRVNGFPIIPVAPCEGTGYEIGSMSIIEGARNLESAKKWYDWALGPDAQKLMPKAKAYQVPSNAGVAPPPEAPKVEQIKLIDYDFKKYGSSAERKRLLAKWDKDVKPLPR
ncbi:MAG: ABC transporter substrate-binding protein [Rhodospirillales bacterium]|nr:ABC transporter substrate-binding protein [Rhodospirillales bacterium]MDH3911093.1 ABC transporter substrate-binding protein [Rhodospirillales bacterium]MDH3918622.1 ABC transporter substrate-binding protein [Rhodospirillales bacterium]MDH3968362.1 ABC transporter substrate-binding protein [Rhodospirillales bacterium]